MPEVSVDSATGIEWGLDLPVATAVAAESYFTWQWSLSLLPETDLFSKAIEIAYLVRVPVTAIVDLQTAWHN